MKSVHNEPVKKSTHKPEDSDHSKKTVIGFHSKSLVSVAESDFIDISETEIAAEISVPQEGSWGWVVVAASFLSIFILDGNFFTFGSIYKDISQDLEVDESLVTLINSVAIALYFITGPIVSALINRYGFRFCAMTGSIIVSFAYCASYFAQTYIILLISFGIIPGLGGCFIYMTSQLVVGFYFERLRAIAMSIAGLGQSFGVMTISTVNAYICQLAGWRTTALLHSGLFGLIYFISMAYRPLVSLIVTQSKEENRTVAYLPSLSTMSLASPSRKKLDSQSLIAPSRAERVFQAVSNVNFPTVADMLEEEEEEEAKDEAKPGPSSKKDAQPPMLARTIEKSLNAQTKKEQVTPRESQIVIKLSSEPPPKVKPKWWKRCYWEKHAEKSRPMYRDDAFYTGRLENLPAYQKSLMSTRRKKTGLEYRMAVSRTVTPVDLREQKGVFTTAVRRILATMLNTVLLRRRSFLMVCVAGFLVHVGLLIPYVFLPNRNREHGIEQKHCNLFLSVIGFANAVGRLIAGILASKFNPVRMYSIACMMAGASSIASNFLFEVWYQYFCCVIFGIAAAHMSTLRSLVIVDLYGLNNLTNATGMLLMFQGFGCLLSTPLSSVLKYYFGYFLSFCVAGVFMVSGGMFITRVKGIAKHEDAKEQERLAKYKAAKAKSINLKKKAAKKAES